MNRAARVLLAVSASLVLAPACELRQVECRTLDGPPRACEIPSPVREAPERRIRV